MAGRILIGLSCFLCAGAFFLIGWLCRISSAPVPFFTGSEEKLKQKVTDVPGYHQRMGILFRGYGLSWLVTALLGILFPPLGIAGIAVQCTLGLFTLYRSYQKILQKCS